MYKRLLLAILAVPVLAQAQDTRLLPGCAPAFAAWCPAEPVEEESPAPEALPPPPDTPLFSRELVARDTPPEMLALFNAPTPAHVDAYLDAQAARVARMRVVEGMIKARMLERRGR